MKKQIARLIGATVAGIIILLVVGLAYIKLALPNVGPAPVFAIRADSTRIEHGKYLANHVAACMDCHSTRDFSKWTGPVLIGTEGKGGEAFRREDGFPGNYYAPNLTPTHLGQWTDGELYRAITAGVSRDGHALFPIMPYRNYARMAPDDIKDIIAYLRTLKPIQHTTPASQPDFPMNFIINTIPAKPEGGTRPAATDRLAYGRYLVTFASCAECHTPRNERGASLAGMDFAGGNAFSVPTGTVYSANITPARSGIGSWSREAFIARFKAYAAAKQPDIREGEANSVMPWTTFGQMSERDLGAIYEYLRTLKPVENKVVPFTPKAKMIASR